MATDVAPPSDAPTGAARRGAVAAVAQRRTVRTLVGSQALGGIGTSSGAAVGTLLGEQVLGRADLAGLVNTAQVLGAAVLAYLLAVVMARRGRRVGLALGYAAGGIGAVLAVGGGVVGSFPLLLFGSALFGGGGAANTQARYAATDLATPARRGRTLSTVVWATTVGAVLGPNLLGPAGWVADRVGLPPLTGPYLISLVGVAIAAAIVFGRLRPDPLLLARELAGAGGQPTAGPRRSLRQVGATLRAHPRALGAIGVIAGGHAVMVAVMVMTPLHMNAGGAQLQIIGFVIGVHVLGMYAFSPIVGWAADRAGRTPVIGGGAVLLLLAAFLAGGTAAGASWRLGAGLFALGLGWSCCFVAGSTLLTESVPLAERPAVQGASDLAMGVAAAAGSALSGLVVGLWGYGVLNGGAAVLALGIAVLAALPAMRRAPVVVR